MTYNQSGLVLVLSILASPAARAQSAPPAVVLSQPIRSTGAELELNLQAADAATLSQSLGDALGGAVRVDGPLTAPVTLDLRGMPARAALDTVAGALHGSWHPIYWITPGQSPAARRPVPLGRKVTANLDHVSARAAFALVARAGGGTLDTSSGLEQPVSLVAKEAPIEHALDELAAQAGVTWSVTYVFKPGVAPPIPVQRAASQPRSAYPRSFAPGAPPGSGLPGAPPTERRSFPIPFDAAPHTPAPGTGDDAGKMLALGLTQVMQMPAPQRQRAVKDFATQLDQQFRQMLQLPPPRRIEQMTAMRPVYQAALRTYNGLVPTQRREFQPIIDVFNRWMH
jgi:hypothetical protein